MQKIFVKSNGEADIHLPPVIHIEAAPLTILQRMAVLTSTPPKSPVTLVSAPWGQSNG